MKLFRAALLAMGLMSSAWLPVCAQYSAPPVQAPAQGAAATVVTTDPALLYPPEPVFHMMAGDAFTVKIFGQTDFATGVRVNIDGDAELPYVGFVHLAGLTIPEAEAVVAKRLQDAGLYVDPLVSISVTDGPNAIVSVVGENHATVPLVGQRGLLQVLNLAGGLPAGASHIVTINRPGVNTPIVVDLGTDPAHSTMADIPIFPGDIIVTGKVGVAFAIGSFKSPGIIQLNGNTPVTLMQATATIGGPAFEAKKNDLRLIRTVNGQRTVVKLDMASIFNGKAPDPILQPNDILYLPQSTFKTILSSPGTGLIFSLSGLILSIANFARY
jgi:polysaccharide export outer membrane protein